MTRKFKVYFNEQKQWFYVHVADNARRFKRTTKSHAYYVPAENRRKRRGLFGHIYLSRFDNSRYTHDCIAHEAQHLVYDWFLCRKNGTMENEENVSIMIGDIVGKIASRLVQ